MKNIPPQFDVFLAHNSLDKPQVRVVAKELTRRGLNPWLDEEQIPPGRSFQDEIQQAIPLVKSAAIFIGLPGLGAWQAWELKALISQCVRNKIPVISVLLPGINNLPEQLLFLEQFRWVSFSEQVDDVEALNLLEWGITGRKPERKPQPIPQPIQINDLSSEKGVDYRRLRDLLAAGKWKEADEETLTVMVNASGTEEEGWLDVESIKNFPCTDLRTIDQLWIKYSNGHFGFSVQKKIYLSVGGKLDSEDYLEAWEKFGDRVGWRVNRNWINYPEKAIFDTLAPSGHLPLQWTDFLDTRVFWVGGKGLEIQNRVLFSRRDL